MCGLTMLLSWKESSKVVPKTIVAVPILKLNLPYIDLLSSIGYFAGSFGH